MPTTPTPPGGTAEPAPGLRLTRMGFGTMQLPGPGVWGPPKDPDEAVAVLRRALGLGVTHLDTSAFYGPHIANDLIRAALHPYPDDLVLATKVGVVRDDARGWNAAASPTQLREQVEDNLSHLGLEHLDLVYLRVGGDGLLAPDDGTPFAESFATLAELWQRGLIRHLGLSGVTTAQLAAATEIAPVVAVQNRFNLLDRSGEDVLRACEERRIAFVPYFPLAAGLLRPGLDKSQIPPGMAPTDAQERTLDEIVRRHEATRAQVALAWLLAYSAATLVIPGTSSLKHLEENVAAADLHLSEDEIAHLANAV